MFRFLTFMVGSLFVMFLIFGLVQLGLSGEQEYQGKFIILGISMILGLGGSLLFPVIIKKMYPMLQNV